MYNSGNNSELVKTSLDEVFYSEFDYDSEPGIVTARNPLAFKQSSTDRGAVITSEYQPPGAWEEHIEEEERTIATVRTDNKTTHSVANYKKTLKIPQEFFEDDLHDSVRNSVNKVAFRGRTTQDKNALDIYAGGFDSTTTSDAAYLWSNSHAALNGSTIDNLETGALTASNLETLVKALLEQKAQDGDLGGHVPQGMLVPTALFPDALEITKSELKSGSTDNDLNYFSLIYPGMQVLQSPYLGASYHSYANADTSHYLIGRQHSITRWVRIPVETKLVPPDTDDQDRWTYKARYREVVAPVSWEGAVASNGTT
jgi:hypothetical protein